MQGNCQIPTPKPYVQVMLDKAGYQENLYGKTVLENSCGEGNILSEIIRRYIKDCRIHNLSDKIIKQGLERDINAYEIDKKIIRKCKYNMDKVAQEMGITNVKWNIYNMDYLTSPFKTYDYIIGNPPYITYHNLSERKRKYLKENYSTCSKGRFDYCYAFIEKSHNSLNEGGVLVYLIPFSIFRNKFAQAVRDTIKSDLVSIYDFTGEDIFKGVVTSASIICLVKGTTQEYVEYLRKLEDKRTYIQKSKLNKKWFFLEQEEGLRFGDYFKVQNSVATLCNEAFLLTNYVESNQYCIVGKKKIEKEIVRAAVSVKSCKKGKMDKIIFPYRIIDNGYKHFSEKEMLELYPKTMEYLSTYKKQLEKRKISNGVNWFEYGRTQALNEVYGDKLIIPMIITTKVTAYEAGPNTIPYAGYFVKVKKGSKYNLQYAKKILESKHFYEYVKNVGTPTTSTSYRISVKEIENYTFTN